MKVEEYTIPAVLRISFQAHGIANKAIEEDMLSPYGSLLHDCDIDKQHLAYTLSLGDTTDKNHLHDLMHIWSAYAGADLRPLKVSPAWCNPGEYYYLDEHPEYTLVWQIEKFMERYGRDAAGADLTPGMQRIQDAFDNGIESAIAANLERGIPAADLCAGRG